MQPTPIAAQVPPTMNLAPGAPQHAVSPTQPVVPPFQGCTPPMVFHSPQVQVQEQTTTLLTDIDLTKLDWVKQ